MVAFYRCLWCDFGHTKFEQTTTHMQDKHSSEMDVDQMSYPILDNVSVLETVTTMARLKKEGWL